MKIYIYDGLKKKLRSKFKREDGIIKEYFKSISSISKYLFSEKYRKEYSFMKGYDSINSNSGNNLSNVNKKS